MYMCMVGNYFEGMLSLIGTPHTHVLAHMHAITLMKAFMTIAFLDCKCSSGIKSVKVYPTSIILSVLIL